MMWLLRLWTNHQAVFGGAPATNNNLTWAASDFVWGAANQLTWGP